MGQRVFEGVKVAEFAWLLAGPLIDKYLADHGATVIKIESFTNPCTLRLSPPYQDNKPGLNRSAWWAKYNSNKYGVSLNLSHPKAREVALRIAKWADIVAESFAPGVIRKWGLNYEELVKIKPDLIMISSANQGQTGPHRGQPAYGMHIAALAGFVHLTNWPDQAPATIYGAYTDFIAPHFAVAALVAALDYRRKTGQGQYLDLSQFECAVHFLGPALLDYSVNGRVWNRMGNRCPHAAPHGVYRCRGEDRWCAIAVFTDEEWQALQKVMGNPLWAKEARFATVLDRKENEDELDRLVEGWTAGFTAEEVMALMQGAGVAAGVVKDNEDVYLDPQLEHRHYFRKLDHPEMGSCTYNGPSFHLSQTPGELTRAAPCLGQDNEYVYTKVLGMSDAEFTQLLEEGVFE